MAVKVAGVTPWIHHMRMKRTYYADPENVEWTAQRDPTAPRETKIVMPKVAIPRTERTRHPQQCKCRKGNLLLAQARAQVSSNAVEWNKGPEP